MNWQETPNLRFYLTAVAFVELAEELKSLCVRKQQQNEAILLEKPRLYQAV